MKTRRLPLDPPLSDVQLLAIKEQRDAEGWHNGVRLGENSPLRQQSKPETKVVTIRTKPDGSVDLIDPGNRMNSWEYARATQLEEMAKAGIIEGWRFEGITLRLADRTTYTPDFLVVIDPKTEWGGVTGFRFVLEEVKGFWREDARVKIKTAARQHPWFRFRAMRRKTTAVGGWEVEEIKR